MAKRKTTRVALIGAGFIAEYHARALKAIEDVEIAAVCGLPLAAARAFAQRFGIREASDDALALAGRTEIDAAVIGIPNKFHAPYANAFLKQGKDVFVEKPLAMNAKEGHTIARTAKATGAKVMVGHMWRFDLEVNYIRQIVQEGQLGTVFKTKGFGIHVNWGPSGWFTQKALAGGGALADMGVHAIDTVRYILGDPQPKQVYARIGTYLGDYDVDDTGLLMITWEGGTTSLIESGWWQPHMDGPEAGTRLYGTKGYASLFPTTLKLRLGFLPGEFTPAVPPRREHCDQLMYDNQMRHFVACIRERKDPCPGLAEGQTIMRIIDAAYASAESGQAVEL